MYMWLVSSIAQSGYCFQPVPTFCSHCDAQRGKNVQTENGLACILVMKEYNVIL